MHDAAKGLGVVLDIGTTTIQGRLIELRDKTALSYFSCLNEQLTIGHDVISRIKFSLERCDGLKRLHKKVISSINFLIANLLTRAKRERADIINITAVGNTASYHFVLLLPPDRLIEPPYQPEYKAFVKRPAAEMGIEAGSGCEFNFLPNIGGFVGSDAIAVIVASDLDTSSLPLLAVDVGTNGEIIIGSKDRIYVTSTAAGPAFEGWHINCGMRAVEGAVESVKEKGEGLTLKVIGGGEPEGISASGLIDIISILLKRGHIDEGGRLEKDFVVYNGRKRIRISQNDVRQVQLAKAAFAAGIKLLRSHLDGEIAKVIITGNFGSYLDMENAKRIGIIPQDIDVEKVEFLPNGALKGVETFIREREAMALRIGNILARTVHLSLSEDSNFQREFTASMKFYQTT